MKRQFACAVLAVLVSLLSFACVLQGSRAWWQGQGGSQIDAGSVLAVRLVEAANVDAAPRQDSAAHALARYQPWGRVTQELNQKSIEEFTQESTQEPTQKPTQEPVANSTTESTQEPAQESIDPPVDIATHVTTGETISKAVMPAAGYVPAAELSERPVLLQDLDPELELPALAVPRADAADPLKMPDSSSGSALESSATGILLINAQGSVDRLLFESPGYPRYLEVMLAQRFAEVRFLPGKIDGRPVPSALRITVQLQ